jgi:hypothetical protein
MGSMAQRIDFPFEAGWPVSKCQSCRKPIVWITTAKGKKMPLDLRSAVDGRAESHFAHCENARMHRRDEKVKKRRGIA